MNYMMLNILKKVKTIFCEYSQIAKIGIDLNDCEKVNDGINDILDSADYIKEQYFLEVSSPGVERVLRKDRHLEQNIGKEIVVNLFKSINNQKQLEGILEKFDEKNIYLRQEGIIEIERKNISLIKIKFEW